MSKRAKLNTIRVIGGQWRGRRLPVVDSAGLRPTIDRVRETLFNWLMHDIVGARCLDLFAGSGVLGLESLSRGAEFVQFIESNDIVSKQLDENLSLLADNTKLSISKVNCTSAVTYLSNINNDLYDIVFIDPPFQSELLAQSLTLLVENNWIADGTIIYLEQDVSKPLADVPSSWSLHRQGVAGQSAYFLYIS